MAEGQRHAFLQMLQKPMATTGTDTQRRQLMMAPARPVRQHAMQGLTQGGDWQSFSAPGRMPNRPEQTAARAVINPAG